MAALHAPSRGEDEFTTLFPMPVRALIGGAGAFCIAVTIKELWRGIWPVNALTPFFLLILSGGVLVGTLFVLGAICSGHTRWTLGAGHIMLDTRNLLGRRSIRVTASDVAGLTVHEHDWDSGPATWFVRMTLATGEVFATPDYGKRETAETKKAAIMAALGMETED